MTTEITKIDQSNIADFITTILLFFVTEEKRVKRSLYDTARAIAEQCVAEREGWLTALGHDHELFLENPKTYEHLYPKSRYAALAGYLLRQLGVPHAIIGEWCVNAGASIGMRLSDLGKEVDLSEHAEVMEWFVYIQSSQTSQPVPFRERDAGGDLREFFRRGFCGEIEIVD